MINTKVSFILIPIIVFFMGYLLLYRPQESFDCRRNRLNSNKSFAGIIVSKNYNTNNHQNEKIRLDSGDHFEWEDDFFNPRSLYKKLSVGDKVLKANESLIIIINDHDSFNLKFPCNM